VFALLSLGTKFFLFMRLSQSLESQGGKKTKNKNKPAPSGWRLSITAGPSFKWWVPASLRRMKGPTAALGCWNEEEQDEVMPERRHRAARRICPECGEKKNTQSSSDSLSPSRRNRTPRCEKDYLQKRLFLPIPE